MKFTLSWNTPIVVLIISEHQSLLDIIYLMIDDWWIKIHMKAHLFLTWLGTNRQQIGCALLGPVLALEFPVTVGGVFRLLISTNTTHIKSNSFQFLSILFNFWQFFFFFYQFLTIFNNSFSFLSIFFNSFQFWTINFWQFKKKISILNNFKQCFLTILFNFFQFLTFFFVF